MLPLHLGCRTGDAGGVVDVEGQRFGFQAFGGQGGDRGLRLVLRAGGNQHLHAGLRQLPGGFVADALVGTGDQGNLAHLISPVSRWYGPVAA